MKHSLKEAVADGTITEAAAFCGLGPWIVPCERCGEEIAVRADAYGLFYSEHLCLVLVTEALNPAQERLDVELATGLGANLVDMP